MIVHIFICTDTLGVDLLQQIVALWWPKMYGESLPWRFPSSLFWRPCRFCFTLTRRLRQITLLGSCALNVPKVRCCIGCRPL